MPTPNTALSWSSEASEQTKEKVQKTPIHTSHNLLKEAIFRELWNPIHPEKFNEYKKKQTTYNKAIEKNMYDLRSEDMDTWGSITDDAIQSETTTSNIAESIVRMSQNLVLMRKRAFDRAIELFPNIINQWPTWSRTLDSAIQLMDETELKTASTRTQYMRKFIHATFPLLKWEMPTEKKDFEEVFTGHETVFDEAGKSRFIGIYRNYTKYNQVPDTDDLDFILEAYSDADDTEKKRILTALWVTLTIKQAYDLKLIDTKFLEALAMKEMQDIFVMLDEEQKISFIRWLRQDNTYVIVASDFDTRELWSVLKDKRRRRILAREIARTLSIDTPDSEIKQEQSIESEIRKRKLKELELKNKTSEEDIPEEWDLFDEFVDEMSGRLRQKDGSPQIENIKVLKTPWAVISYMHEDGSTQYVRVKRVRDTDGKPLDAEDGGTNGIELEWLSVVSGSLRKNQNFSVSYDQFRDFLASAKNANILESSSFDDLITDKPDEAGKNGKIFDARPIISEEPVTASNIAAKINLIDSVGTAYGFEVGTVFIAPVEYEATDGETKKTTSHDGVWTISQIQWDTISLTDPSWIVSERNIAIAGLYELLANTQGFQRVGKIKWDQDMIKELAPYSKIGDIKLSDAGKLLIERSLDDGHGHKEKKEVEVSCFKSEKWWHIRLESIRDGIVRFWEFDDGGNDPTKIKNYAEKHGLDKEIQGLYRWKRMSYASFIRYLEQEKLEATTDDPILPAGKIHHELGHEDHAPHAHMEWSLFKRVMKWQNPASIWKWFEMIYHSIEHTLEKWAKLDAARFALGTSNFLWLPDAVSAQVYSDITTASKEIVEKYEQKIFGLPGPAGRLKCIHIVHNRDSRPEEVMSAINYMLKSYGHLYAEDIKHYQPKVTKKNLETADPGYFAFFDGLVITSKIWDLKTWRKDAYDRAVKEMGTEDDHENEPTEEQLIHALCKMIDGDWGKYPYAASVIKAIGWPGGFEKAWKFEWFDNAHKKGKEQTQMVNAQWRLNKSVSYLETHEIYKAMGAMESMAAKVKEPEFQAMPFIWAVWWYSKFASHTALQKLKGYAENGLSFHGYAFLRNEAGNTVYKNTVKLALHEMGGKEKVDEFEALCNKLEFDSDDKKKTKWAALAMMKFWQRNCNNGLNDMLQGNNGWLTAKAKEWDPTIQEYLKIFYGAHAMQLTDPSIPGGEFGMDWYKEHGYQNMIMTKWEDGLRSLSSMLNKIRYTTTNRWGKPMDKEHEVKIWQYVNTYMEKWLRDTKSFLNNEQLQKEQFFLHREELLEHFAGQLSAGEVTDPLIIERLVNAKEYGYFQDLANLGIDPKGIFSADIARSNREDDYRRWKEGRKVGSSLLSEASTPDIRASFQKKTDTVMSGRTPTDTIKPKAWPRMKRADWDKPKSRWKPDVPVDDDLRNRWWAGDASVQGSGDDHDDGTGI